MGNKYSNSWHRTLYGDFFAQVGLDTQERHNEAKKEVAFLVNELGLIKGDSVLDVPCGAGRHALAFAKKGLNVVGIDISDSCLKLAKRNCKSHDNVKINKGNMTRLAWARGKFDLTANMFSSFGYFKTDAENKMVLKGFRDALKPGGHVVIQNINREWLLKIFDPSRWGETNTYHWQEGTKYNPKTKYVEACRSFINKESGKGEVSYSRMRIYSIGELTRLMRDVGLVKIKVFGDICGSPADRYKSTHPIYIGQRPD